MKWIKSGKYFLVFSLPVCLPVLAISSFAAPTKAQSYPISTSQALKQTTLIAQGFKPPKRGLPPASVGGATRGSSCLQKNNELIPLIPQERLGLTFAERPTLFWYVSASPTTTAEFALFVDQKRNPIYRTTLTLPTKAGIFGFRLPESVPPLAVDQRYRWSLKFVCNQQSPNQNPASEGWVERAEPEPGLLTALAQAGLRKRPALYAEAGIWYEALTAFIELRQTQPYDRQIRNDWQEFLQSVELGRFATTPISKD